MNMEQATQKQIEYIKALISERDENLPQVRAAQSLLGAPVELFNKTNASLCIDSLVKIPAKPLTTSYADSYELLKQALKNLETGLYDIKPYITDADDNTKIPSGKYVLVVNPGNGKSVKAKALFSSWNTKSGVSLKNVYAGTVAKLLAAGKAEKLETGMVSKLGKKYNFCMYCGRLLTDEVSVALGRGPVCAKKYEK